MNYAGLPKRFIQAIAILALSLIGAALPAPAHPLGNFTINHYSGVELSADGFNIHYVIDMAEIPALQEKDKIDLDGDGLIGAGELKSYASAAGAQLAEGLRLIVDQQPLALAVISSTATMPPGAGGLATLRIDCRFAARLERVVDSATHRVHFEDGNFSNRIGWREIVVTQNASANIFDSTAYGNSASEALTVYPEGLLSAPLDERSAEFSFNRSSMPEAAAALVNREGKPVGSRRDRFVELISVRDLTLPVALFGLVVAMVLGAGHALSPGHGKTVVGAYLVGSRGTARHAAFLGMTVTITHTAGVFALGLVTLFASRYILPERLFPILGLVSGAVVLAIGLKLFINRLRAALKRSNASHEHHHEHDHEHDHHHGHDHHHDHDHHHHDGESTLVHSHGGPEHTHVPPGADGTSVTWRSLLALGISGGLLPCPSALVVMLSAISLHRVGYGLLLVVAFSIGLASTLTAVGLAFVYAKRILSVGHGAGRLSVALVRILPVVSALVVACAGGAICYESVMTSGTGFFAPLFEIGRLFKSSTPLEHGSAFSILGFGLVFGLRHAMEADHLAAVSTIVSQRRGLLSSSLVGGLWGAGHTISLLIAGTMVLLLGVRIGETPALVMELCVGVMLIGLGINAMRRVVRCRAVQAHGRNRMAHAHTHSHIHTHGSTDSSQHGFRIGIRPLMVGMMHGLAGSAALMLLVLSTVSSSVLGLMFIAVFGIGSIGGMLAMSALVALPLRVTADRFKRTHRVVQILAAVFSIGLGFVMVCRLGMA